MSVGMTKFYSVACFAQIGGFVREVMWDAIDCHKARQLGWTPTSFNEPDLAFEHLRPMGSSQQNIYVGRRRHGFGQYFMGSHPLYFLATAVRRMLHPPYILGGMATLQGYVWAMFRGEPQYDDAELRRFIRDYQVNALLRGKKRAIARIEAQRKSLWAPDHTT